MKFLARALPFAAFATPALALAQFDEIGDLADNILDFMNGTIVLLIFAIAFLFFLWGVAQYFIIGRDAEEAKEAGKEYMLWAIGGFVVMVSVWGIVNLVANGLGFSEDEQIQNIPDAPTNNN